MRLESYDEKADERSYLMIRPDPRCPECVTIMDWRSAHRGIAITNGAKIKLSDYKWGSRHLHMRDARDAHSPQEPRGTATQANRWERMFPSGGMARTSTTPKSVAPFLRST